MEPRNLRPTSPPLTLLLPPPFCPRSRRAPLFLPPETVSENVFFFFQPFPGRNVFLHSASKNVFFYFVFQAGLPFERPFSFFLGERFSRQVEGWLCFQGLSCLYGGPLRLWFLNSFPPLFKAESVPSVLRAEFRSFLFFSLFERAPLSRFCCCFSLSPKSLHLRSPRHGPFLPLLLLFPDAVSSLFPEGKTVISHDVPAPVERSALLRRRALPLLTPFFFPSHFSLFRTFLPLIYLSRLSQFLERAAVLEQSLWRRRGIPYYLGSFFGFSAGPGAPKWAYFSVPSVR